LLKAAGLFDTMGKGKMPKKKIPCRIFFWLHS